MYHARETKFGGQKFENFFPRFYDEEILNSILAPFLKNGGGIHIKKKNRGKFTAAAKADGEGVLEHARKVLADPNATPLQKKRALFCVNASHWKH